MLFGREKEVSILQQAQDSVEAEMISVIGRRRVGKTFLIEQFFKDRIIFHLTGAQNAPLEEQLENFAAKLGDPDNRPKSWNKAFHLLQDFLGDKLKEAEGKKVIFLDELPWLATPKSGFLRALGYFWNNWAARQNLIIVICGSAASWMIRKVVNHKGGLHNRITKRIHLHPFTLGETEKYLKSRQIFFDRYQIIQLYMATGGVPHYLKEIRGGLSAVQNIENMCFSETGLLRNEFSRLYSSLFVHSENHIAIIKALGNRRQGLTRPQLVEISKVAEGGTMARTLEELIQSGFISSYRPFGKKKKEKLYRLTDEYSLFYLHFIEDKEHEGENIWHHISQTQTFKIWSGYTFESICLKHIPQIKKAMSIAGIYSISGSFYKKGTNDEDGAQIDLLIDRNDLTISLFEIKFHTETFSLTKSYTEKLREKMRIFRETTKTKKQLFWVFISTFGLKPNQYSTSIIAQSLTMDDLFD